MCNVIIRTAGNGRDFELIKKQIVADSHFISTHKEGDAVMQNEQGELPTVEEAEIAIHKLRCHPSFNIPKHLKKQSKKWLRDNGLNTKIEGLGDGNAS